MDTKVCKKCGWVLSIKDPNSRCPVCKTKFDVGICRVCGELVEFYREDRNVCKKCYDTVIRNDGNRKLTQRRKDIFEYWLDLISKVPKNYKTLTEEQWLEAVMHFGECAVCGNESIDARGYFIPFNKGGRYCDWNMIPVCERCATAARKNPNYFMINRPKGLTKIIDYLEVKLNGALAKDTEHKQ